MSGASSSITGDPQASPYAIKGKWNPVDSTCTHSMHRDNSACTHTMAGRMRWTTTGLVIVGTWAHDAGDDAMTATATLGEFSCSEDPDPLHCHAISHPAGLWMGIHVPGLGHTTARDVNPVTQCHLIAHIDTTLGRWFGVGFDPNGDFFAFEVTATPEAAHSPDDRATRISLCASVRKGDETVDFTAFGSVDDGNIQDIYSAPPSPWRGHRVLGTEALLRPEPHPAQPADDSHQHTRVDPRHTAELQPHLATADSPRLHRWCRHSDRPTHGSGEPRGLWR